MQQAVSLFYREGSSDKEYHVSIEPKGPKFVVNFAYGRRGSTLSTGTKTNTPVDSAAALQIFNELVRKKKAKGYTEGESGTPYQHSENQTSGIFPQLLNPIDEAEASRLVSDEDWCMQEKMDGRRLMLQKQGAAIHGINRKGLLVGLPSPVVVDAQKFPNDFIMDGEAVGDTLHAFDLLELNGVGLKGLPYEERLNQLTDLLDAITTAHIEIVETAYSSSEKMSLLKRLKDQNREGVVFKQLDAPYTPGRPNSGGPQLKHKFWATLTAVVINLNDQRSVEIGLVDGDGWHSAGNVTIPTNHTVPRIGDMVEIRYLYAFKESGCLFQPTYLGERSDVELMDCKRDQLKFKPENEEEN